jgi:uncharacterized protein (DUF1501 family)
MQRRAFLQTLPGMAAMGSGLFSAMHRSAHAAAFQADDYKALVCIFLFGGNDGNNLIVPIDARYNAYASGRGRLALPKADLLAVGDYGLHPQLAGIRELWSRGKAAAVANVGPLLEPLNLAQYKAGSARIPNNLFSHSDQQQQWHTASADGSLRTGWGGRVADMVMSANGTAQALTTALAVGGRSTFQTGVTASPFTLSPSGRFGFDVYKKSEPENPINQAFAKLIEQKRDHLFEAAWLETMNRSIETQRMFNDVVNATAPLKTEFPGSSLADQLKTIARLIAGRNALGAKRQVFFASLGGFDTHGVDQLTDQAELFSEISTAVAAFYNATVELGVADNVTTFTASDFGRDFPANGNGGSDHGWGNHHLVVGGAVKGGQVYGDFPELVVGGKDDAGGGRWIPTTSVEEYAATFARWFGVPNSDLSLVSPNLGRFAQRNVGWL